MRTFVIRLSSISDARARFLNAGQKALEGSLVSATPSVNFPSYDDMHRVLAPPRLAIMKAMADKGRWRYGKSPAVSAGMCRPSIRT
jgi:predicted transcriptional regulator